MTDSYTCTRGRLEEYFDRTAAKTWERLTSDAPVSKIRQTVRAGRDRTRAALLRSLPANLSGLRVLDAGCGVGQLSAELAHRGAEVVAVDISNSLLDVARQRISGDLLDRIEFRAGDMLDARLGDFDHVVAMDSLIHYETEDIVAALVMLGRRTRSGIHFTVAPRTPLLAAMHMAGKLFPRGDRSPAIKPVAEAKLRRLICRDSSLRRWQLPASTRVSSGFYISQAMRLVR
ncbi:MAG: magnesium protoporphyrin IX methyltransferase [Pseudomonadota bacterium]